MENKDFALSFKVVSKIFVVEFSGYLASGMAEKLLPQIDWRLAQGCRNFIFDFAGVTMLESAAVATILTTTENIVDNNAGYLAFSNLNEVSRKVLEMVGVFLYAGCFEKTEEAIAEMND